MRLFGADYSVYVRIVRHVLAEKGVAYELVPVDIFDRDGLPDWYLQRHPFRRIPAFEHGSLNLFETGAITRYIDEAFDGPHLQPEAVADRAMMNQAISLIDSYAYRAMVWGVYVERVEKPGRNEAPDEALIASSLATARTCLQTFSGLIGQGPWLAGETLSLADLHAAPLIWYFIRSPEGAAMLAEYPALAAWWQTLTARPRFDDINKPG